VTFIVVIVIKCKAVVNKESTVALPPVAIKNLQQNSMICKYQNKNSIVKESKTNECCQAQALAGKQGKKLRSTEGKQGHEKVYLKSVLPTCSPRSRD
jgi:hypothetical protein